MNLRGKVVPDHIQYNGPVLEKDNPSIEDMFNPVKHYEYLAGKNGSCYFCNRLKVNRVFNPPHTEFLRKGRHGQMVVYDVCATCQGRLKNRLGLSRAALINKITEMEANYQGLNTFKLDPTYDGKGSTGLNVPKLNKNKSQFIIEVGGKYHSVEQFTIVEDHIIITTGEITMFESSGQGAFLPEPSLRDPQEELPTGKVLGAKSFADMMQGYDEQEETQDEDEETQAPSPESQALVNSIISSW